MSTVIYLASRFLSSQRRVGRENVGGKGERNRREREYGEREIVVRYRVRGRECLYMKSQRVDTSPRVSWSRDAPVVCICRQSNDRAMLREPLKDKANLRPAGKDKIASVL